jgi:tRNA pseudouridine38-40 synthase
VGIEFHIAANRFLHHMVRYLVGTLVSMGRGLRPVDQMAQLLTPSTQLLTSPPAPAQGLFLREIAYP